MKQLFYIVIFLLTTLYGQSQVIRQNGVTYRYNGKNPRTPIGGVYIKPITAANGVVSEESNGTFTLALDNLKMGSRIGDVRVTKQGMMVFNQQTVDEWSVRKDPLCLILCNADEFQKQKKNLIAIGESQAKKKYDQKLAELKKQNDAKQLKIDEYYNKLDSLEKEYQNAIKHMNEYADVFARIDESEVDTVTQRAIELFNRGEIEGSLHLLEQQNYMEKIKQANRTIEQAVVMISTAEQAKSLAEQDKQKYMEGIKTQITGYKLQNEWNKAKELLKGLADNLNTLDAIYDYAYFCRNQNDFKEAEDYYLRFEVVINSEEIEDSEKLEEIATIKNNLASLYSDTQRFSESEDMYKAAIAIIERLSKANPQAYEHALAMLYNNLAILYFDTQRFAESETMHKQSLAIRERLAKSNPQSYEPDMAICYNNLGNLYSTTNRFAESETMHKQSLAIRERLAKSNPQSYEPDMAICYNNLGNLYFITKRFVESETMHKQSLAIRKRLAKSNPQSYEPDMAMSYNNLGMLYYYTKCLTESEEMHNSAFIIYDRLAKSNPQAYEPYLAKSYLNLAMLYSDTNRFSESEEMYKSAIVIYERLAKSNSQAYEPALAMSYYNFGHLYFDTHRFSESEEMYKCALEKYLYLYGNNSQIYDEQLMECHFRLGITLLALKKTHDAQETFLQSLLLASQRVKAGIYTSLNWKSLFFLTKISSYEKDYDSAYAYNEELLTLLKASNEEDLEIIKEVYHTQLVSQSLFANLLEKFNEGEHYSLEALKLDSTKHLAYTYLAAALLFQGKVKEAEELYRQYKAEFKDGFLDDFAEYERLGIIPEERKKDVERIKAMLNEP